MKKIFLSQPMNGLSNDEILVERELLKERAADIFGGFEGIEFISTFIEEDAPNALKSHNKGLWYLGRSLQMLAEADYILMAPKWRRARGCRIEAIAAELYGIKILDL